MIPRTPFFFALLLLLSAPYPVAPAVSAQQDARNYLAETANLFSQVIDATKPGVVYITVKKSGHRSQTSAPNTAPLFDNPEIERFFGSNGEKPKPPRPPATPSYAHGSGFVISADGYILTNGHVIAAAEEITVTTATRETFPARVIGADSRSDIGLIKIEAEHLTPLPLGSSELLKTGEWVLAFGSPFENIQTVTAGIVSATGRSAIGISDYEEFIQTDAAINPGNSGGPLVNIFGEVIGINTAFITQTGGYMGVGFAVPIDMARSISSQLLETGRVVRGWLGVALKDADPVHLQEQNLPLATRAARVVGIQGDSPAKTLDLVEGDLIISLNTIPISGAADLRNRVALTAPGTTVTLGFYRNGNLHSVTARLGTLK